MAIAKTGRSTLVTTTDIHPARGIGKALHHMPAKANWGSTTTRSKTCCASPGAVNNYFIFPSIVQYLVHSIHQWQMVHEMHMVIAVLKDKWN